MAYVPVPKDLTAVKTKVMLNLTKRQLICFGSGILVGVPLFFLIRSKVSRCRSFGRAAGTHQQPGRAHGEAICYGEKEFPVLRYC